MPPFLKSTFKFRIWTPNETYLNTLYYYHICLIFYSIVRFNQYVFSVPTYAAQNADTRRVVQELYPFMSNYSMAQKHPYFSWDILQFSKKKYFVSVDFQLRVEIKSVRPVRLPIWRTSCPIFSSNYL